MSNLVVDSTGHDLTFRIICAAMVVHNKLGPGYKEEIYSWTAVNPYYGIYSFNCRDLRGCRNLRKALLSIWRMRSRVRPNFCPTSSSV